MRRMIDGFGRFIASLCLQSDEGLKLVERQLAYGNARAAVLSRPTPAILSME